MDDNRFLRLAPDELEKVTAGMRNPLDPKNFVALASTCKGLLEVLDRKKLRMASDRADHLLRRCAGLAADGPAVGAAMVSTRLAFTDCIIGPSHAETLGELMCAGWLPRLDTLILRKLNIGNYSPGTQVNWPMRIFHQGLGDAAGGLVHLDLSDNKLGNRLAPLFGVLPSLVNLRHLNIVNNLTRMTVANQVRSLATAIADGALQRCSTLRIGGDVGDAELALLLETTPSGLKHLAELALPNNRITPAGLLHFASVLTQQADSVPKLLRLHAYPATRRGRTDEDPPAWLAPFEARGIYVDGGM